MNCKTCGMPGTDERPLDDIRGCHPNVSDCMAAMSKEINALRKAVFLFGHNGKPICIVCGGWEHDHQRGCLKERS